jgi:hypothetical protein
MMDDAYIFSNVINLISVLLLFNNSAQILFVIDILDLVHEELFLLEFKKFLLSLQLRCALLLLFDELALYWLYCIV